MSDWVTTKDRFKKVYDELSNYMQNQLNTDLQNLNSSTASYINKGGITQNPTQDGSYNAAIEAANRINKRKAEFMNLNNEISTTIKNMSTSNDMGQLLIENGNLQQQIQSMEKQENLTEQDAKSAELRDNLLRSKESNITKHQIFMLGRPLKPSSIPYLWAISVLFIGIGLMIFYQFIPSMPPMQEGVGIFDMLKMFIFDSRFFMVLSMALAFVVIFLALRVANVI
jgi:hypothetical protein